MESWLIADAASLEKFFGDGFRAAALPSRADLEQVERDAVLTALKQATKDTSKGEYKKGSVSFAALAEIDPNTVKSRMGYCRRLVDCLDRSFT